MAATLPGRTHGLGIITKRLLEDLHLEPQLYAHMNLWATLLGAAFCLPCGWLMDRYGLRTVTTAVLVALALTVLGMSQVHDSAWLLLALTLTRGFGQSMLSVASITMIGKWFQRNLALAMGIYSVLLSLMMAAAITWLGAAILESGWRVAWGQLAYGLLALAAVTLLLGRNQPRMPEREFAQSPRRTAGTSSQMAASATLRQALQTPCFWMFAVSISLFGMLSAGLSLFNQYVLEERGFGEEVYHRLLVVGMLVGMTSNLVAGGLAKRVPMQRLLTLALLILSGALVMFPFLKTEAHVYLYGVANGAAGGFLTVLFFAVWGHAYGTVALGRIQGVAQMMTVLASAAGPLVVQSSRTATGSYTTIFFVAAGVSLVMAVTAWFTRVPDARAGEWETDSAAEAAAEHVALAGTTS